MSFERAQHYISKVDGAVSGAGGHSKTLTVACTCVRFDLSDDESMSLLREYNERCSPPWTEKELVHKLESARAKAAGERGTMGKGGPTHPRPAQAPQWRPIAPTVAPTVKPVEPALVCPPAAAVPLPAGIELGAGAVLRALYKPDECVRIVQAFIDEDGKEKPMGPGHTFTVREWLRRADEKGGDLAFIWGSPDGAGVYMGLNPMKPGGSKDGDVTDYRFALVESDTIPREEQYASILASKVPCAAIVDSAGDSVHAWVRVDAKDRREFDERVKFLQEFFPWSDPKNTNPSRLSRLPDGRRRGTRQRLLGLNVGATSWLEWREGLVRSELAPGLSIADLADLDTTQDPNCVIGFRDGKSLRWLCKGKAAWLLGPSGVGKSSLVAQIAFAWAMGQPAFGITPAKPLRSLIIQAENDVYDLAEQVQGMIAAQNIIPNTAQWDLLQANIVFRTETSSFGQAFCSKLSTMLAADRPDVVWIDPLMSYAGIDVSKQDQVTPFLRAQLTPILESTGVVMIGVHHTGKPKGAKETDKWSALEWAYAGMGSSELVNWARVVIYLRHIEGRDFELKFAKRGSRSGATHPDGSRAWNSVWIRQSIGRIYWEQVAPPEQPAGQPEGGGAPKAPKAPKENGRPSKVEQVTSLLAIADYVKATPPGGESVEDHGKRLVLFAGGKGIVLSRSTAHRCLEALVGQGKLKMTETGTYAPAAEAVAV